MPQQELSDEPEEKKLKLVHNKKSVWKQGNCDAKTYQQMCQRS
jgi:23S rRNA maturation mini-RNase III